MVVMDRNGFRTKKIDILADELRELGYRIRVFSDFQETPTFDCVQKGVRMMKESTPGIVFAFGGGAAIDTAKLMRFTYENPHVPVEKMVAPFMEMRWRNATAPLVHQIGLVAIPTTAGSGSEMTPFTELVMMGGRKMPICSHALQPDQVIQDPQFLEGVAERDAAISGFQSFVQAVESYVSVIATDHTRMVAGEAAQALYENLGVSHDKVFYASGQTGVAMANTLLGATTAMAMKFGSRFHVPHGMAMAVFVSHVIRYNAVDDPTRTTASPGYPYPMAREQYEALAKRIGGGTVPEFIDAIETLKKKLGLPTSIHSLGIAEKDYMAAVDQMAEETFGDQLGSTNPRFALLSEIRQLYIDAYYSA